MSPGKLFFPCPILDYLQLRPTTRITNQFCNQAMRLLHRYNILLQKKPFATNMATASVLFGLGDILSQTISPSGDTHDWTKTLQNAIYGGLVFAPIVVPWYRFLNDRIRWPTPVKQKKLMDTLARVSVDQLAFAPVGVGLYFTGMGLMEGKHMGEITNKLRKEWWGTVCANWMVWPAVQGVNFAFFGVETRVVVSGLCGVAWNAYLSARERL